MADDADITPMLARLHAAIRAAGNTELENLATAVTDELRDTPHYDHFCEVSPRNLWDEICWCWQEQPDDLDWHDATREIVEVIAAEKVNDLPHYALVCMTAAADRDNHENPRIGDIAIDIILAGVMEKISAAAACRDLELIGPHRADAIAGEIQLQGLPGEVLQYSMEGSDFIHTYLGELESGQAADVAIVSDALLKRMMQCLRSEIPDEHGAIALFFERHETAIAELLMEKDVRPAVVSMMAAVSALTGTEFVR